MNALGQSLLDVSKEFIGPAASFFLNRELRLLGVSLNDVDVTHLPNIAERARTAARQLMDPAKAEEFANAIAACASRGPSRPKGSEHRLATDAAAKLFAAGKFRAAEVAYRELAVKIGDVDSYRGLGRAAFARGAAAAAVDALCEGASARSQAGDRVGAVALLVNAVKIAPTDLAAHRRLAAIVANQGDLAGACEEYVRFIDALVAASELQRAALELAYARETLGEHRVLAVLEERIAGASRKEPPSAAPPPVDPEPPARVDDIGEAKRLLALGKLSAASDVLLDCIAAGFRDREAQRLLVQVEELLGRMDLAAEKCRLLARTYLLDGSRDAAAEVEGLARTLESRVSPPSASEGRQTGGPLGSRLVLVHRAA